MWMFSTRKTFCVKKNMRKKQHTHTFLSFLLSFCMFWVQVVVRFFYAFVVGMVEFFMLSACSKGDSFKPNLARDVMYTCRGHATQNIPAYALDSWFLPSTV